MPFPVRNATALIPQRPPFVFVDKLIYADGQRSVCSFSIPEDNIFVKNGRFSAAGLVESMAQSAAAGTGYLYSKENKPAPVGYIGAVQKLTIFETALANTEITMEINLITNIMQVSLVGAKVSCGDRLLASCEMKIFIRKDA